MKKILALLLALVMVFALAACGSSDDTAETETEETVEETTEIEEAAEAEALTEEEVAEAEGEVADAGEASGEASGEVGAAVEGEASGEASGEMAPSTGEFEITVDGVTGIATYEDVEDGGDEATKTFLITFNGEEITGSINMGVWTADNADYQAIVDAVQVAFEAENGTGGSGEASGEVEAN